MKDLETMQREGRELLHTAGADGFAIDLNLENLDRHTANTWKAALNSILESGLLEEVSAEITISGSVSKYGKITNMDRRIMGRNTLARDIKEFISNMDSV